jgi:hypothetical protein
VGRLDLAREGVIEVCKYDRKDPVPLRVSIRNEISDREEMS